jgi:hypothetical protein
MNVAATGLIRVNEAVNSSDRVAPNDWMTLNNEAERMWAEAALGYYEILFRPFPTTEGKNEKPQPEKSVACLKSENDASRIQTRNITASANSNVSPPPQCGVFQGV